jgi:hypothetical protein
VVNGAEKHPGALSVEDPQGRIVSLKMLNEQV